MLLLVCCGAAGAGADARGEDVDGGATAADGGGEAAAAGTCAQSSTHLGQYTHEGSTYTPRSVHTPGTRAQPSTHLGQYTHQEHAHNQAHTSTCTMPYFTTVRCSCYPLPSDAILASLSVVRVTGASCVLIPRFVLFANVTITAI